MCPPLDRPFGGRMVVHVCALPRLVSGARCMCAHEWMGVLDALQGGGQRVRVPQRPRTRTTAQTRTVVGFRAWKMCGETK